jgi:hypothetical protein
LGPFCHPDYLVTETENCARVVINSPLAAEARCRFRVVDGADSVIAAYQSNFVVPDTFSVRFSIPLVMHRIRAAKGDAR